MGVGGWGVRGFYVTPSPPSSPPFPVPSFLLARLLPATVAPSLALLVVLNIVAEYAARVASCHRAPTSRLVTLLRLSLAGFAVSSLISTFPCCFFACMCCARLSVAFGALQFYSREPSVYLRISKFRAYLRVSSFRIFAVSFSICKY